MKTKADNIISDVEDRIQSGDLRIGEAIPSLSVIRNTYGVSRDTVIRAYRDLQQRGVIQPIQGKGYFVADNEPLSIRAFFLLDELSDYKNTLVKAFEDNLKDRIGYKLFFHHYDPEVFKTLIFQNIGKYTHYIISPIPNCKKSEKILKGIPENQLIYIDRHDSHDPNIQFVGQEYKHDILHCLEGLSEEISKYENIIFIFPEPSFHPVELKSGFTAFCKKTHITHGIVKDCLNLLPKKSSVYLVIDDCDLAYVVEKSQQENLQIGKDIGIISYNETCLKSVIANGITTISTDFSHMGAALAKILSDPDNRSNIRNPAHVIKRNSV